MRRWSPCEHNVLKPKTENIEEIINQLINLQIKREHRAGNKKGGAKLLITGLGSDMESTSGFVTDRFHEKLRAVEDQAAVFRIVATRELKTLHLWPTHRHTLTHTPLHGYIKELSRVSQNKMSHNRNSINLTLWLRF